MGACRPGSPCQQILDALTNQDALDNQSRSNILARDCITPSCDGIEGILDCMTGFSNSDVFVYKGDADASKQTLTFTNTTGGTFTVSNSPALFADNDINVTGGTYNPFDGCVTFSTSSGTTFEVCGFLTGFTASITACTLTTESIETCNDIINIHAVSTYISGNTYTSGDINLLGSNRIYFGYDSNTQNSIRETANNLRIEADDDILLYPDDDVKIGVGSSSQYAVFDGGVQSLVVGATSVPNARLTLTDPEQLTTFLENGEDCDNHLTYMDLLSVQETNSQRLVFTETAEIGESPHRFQIFGAPKTPGPESTIGTDVILGGYTAGQDCANEVLRISGGVAVGILKAVPEHTLDVTGTFRATSTVTFDSIAAAGGGYTGDKILVSDGGEVEYLTTAQLKKDMGIVDGFWSGETANSIFPVSDSNTKVGIGTSTPATTLEVVGRISGDTVIYAGTDVWVGNNIYSGTTNLGDLFANAKNVVTKITAGTNVTISPISGVGDVTINSSGGGGSSYWSATTGTNIIFPATVDVTQVGIGTSTPNKELTVKGTISADTSLFVGADCVIKSPELGSVFIGSRAGEQYVSGQIGNTAVGYLALGFATMTDAADSNTAIGYASLAGMTTGLQNTGLGLQSGMGCTTGIGNIAVGYGAALHATYHSYNVSMGYEALLYTVSGSLGKKVQTDTYNVAIGYRSQYQSFDGAFNTSVGSKSMTGTFSYAGTGNTAMGMETLNVVQTGSYNTTLGYRAGNTITTGDYNIMIGFGAKPTAATVDYEMNIGDIIYGNESNSTGAIGHIGIGYSDPKVILDVHQDPTGLADNTGGGEVVTFGTEDGTDTLAAGRLMYLNTSGVWKYTDADAVETGGSQLLGIALGTAVSDGILLRGYFDQVAYIEGTFAKGAPCYVSEAAGEVDFTAPSGSGDFIRVVGYGTDLANIIYFDPDKTWVELT